jgi:hypothetical protein
MWVVTFRPRTGQNVPFFATFCRLAPGPVRYFFFGAGVVEIPASFLIAREFLNAVS